MNHLFDQKRNGSNANQSNVSATSNVEGSRVGGLNEGDVDDNRSWRISIPMCKNKP